MLLSTILKEKFGQFVPLKQVKIKKDKPIWYTPEVKRMCSAGTLCTLRDVAFDAYKRNRNDANWKIFAKIRNKANSKRKRKIFGASF